MERVQLILASTNSRRNPHHYTMVSIRTQWGHRALQGAKKILFDGKEELPLFDREFEEDVLVWHIASCTFFSSDKVKGIIDGLPVESSAQVQVIEAMLEYLMFLVAVHRQMLLGLILHSLFEASLFLHSLFEASLKALGNIWEKEAKTSTTTGSLSSSSSPPLLSPKDKPEDKLADILLKKGHHELKLFEGGGRLDVYDASVIADMLIKRRQQLSQLLEFIFNVWADKLLYSAVRCSRESHGKQLSRGGELTTILWLIAQHAGLFRVKKRNFKEPNLEEEN